jgi:hypothetical protein
LTPLGDRLRALRREYPRTLRLVWGVALVIVAVDLWVAAKGVGYARETARLRVGMSAVERARLDAALASDSNRLQVMIELARRQARGDVGLHLSIAVDSGVLYLEQEGAVLRTVKAEIGPDAWIRRTKRDSVRITAPRGTRTIVRLLDDTTVVLNGGAVIYARTPSDTSASARPGSVRLDALELRVLTPSLRPGQRVYFY